MDLTDSRPLIGIPAHRQESEQTGASATFVLRERYVRAVADAGGTSVILPPLADEASLEVIYRRLDGLLLPGGGDVAPHLFGQQPHPCLGSVDEELDRVELTLTRWALRDDLPILAICRGIQVLNVAAGGDLIQDIPAQRPGALAHQSASGLPGDWIAHQVTIVPGTRLAALIGGTPLGTNSRHHQAVDQVAEGFVVSATASDGVVEGMERTGGNFALGLQFHPEDLYQSLPRVAGLFSGFVAACRGERG
jgi:putative glutamine amidotransferase